MFCLVATMDSIRKTRSHARLDRLDIKSRPRVEEKCIFRCWLTDIIIVFVVGPHYHFQQFLNGHIPSYLFIVYGLHRRLLDGSNGDYVLSLLIFIHRVGSPVVESLDGELFRTLGKFSGQCETCFVSRQTSKSLLTRYRDGQPVLAFKIE